ncbi:NYN domain-containing protein [Candidatus Woesearchaeota archaeon]|nr:NYN domain-containing protein [Candidatus Woesearchaeota archaeon]
MTATQNKNQRVGVFVDVQNLYYSAKHLYKKKCNFNAILKAAVARRQLIRAIAYVVRADIGDEQHFFDALNQIGFEIKMKDLQTFYGGAKKGDWDVGIAMDIMRTAAKLDTVVLVSGDGDFKELLEHASALGCRTEVIAFGRSASSKLKEQTDMFVDLDKDKDKYLMKSRIVSRRSSSRKGQQKSSRTSQETGSQATGPKASSAQTQSRSQAAAKKPASSSQAAAPSPQPQKQAPAAPKAGSSPSQGKGKG